MTGMDALRGAGEPRAAEAGAALLVSLVLEWEQAPETLERAVAVLHGLHAQAEELFGPGARAAHGEDAWLARFSPPLSVVIVEGDAAASAPVRAADAMARAARELPAGAPVEFRVVHTPGHYYDLKNAGARQARGDVVAFLDGDEAPAHGWLRALVGAFADPAVQLVGGRVCVRPRGIYAKAVGLCWYFQAPGESDGALRPGESFYAGNYAVRRELLPLATYPQMPPGSRRGACRQLAARLLGQGVPIHRSGRAVCWHLPPDGLGAFATRAVGLGRDHRFADPPEARGAATTFGRFGSATRRNLRRVTTERARYCVRPLEAPFVFAVAQAWTTLALAGELLAGVAPRFMQSRFRY